MGARSKSDEHKRVIRQNKRAKKNNLRTGEFPVKPY